jgi:Flp pilus assembly protein TadD
LRKGRQYSVKTFRSLVVVLLLSAACREKPIDQGALITARTVGLEHLQRGRLPEAEQEFKTVIALAPRDPLGYANLGLTYLRAGRYAEAESQLDRARRLDPRNPDVALIVAKLYSLTGRPAEARRVLAAVPPDARVLYALAELDRQSGDSAYAERLRQVLQRIPANLAVRLQLADALLRLGQADSTIRYLEDVRRLRPEPPREAKPHLDAALQALRAGRMADARAALDRFLRLMEVTKPYQAALAEVDGIEGPLVGRPVLAFSPQSLITMRGIGSAPAPDKVHFSDVTGEAGFLESSAPVTALALGDYDGDGEDNLLVASTAGARLYAVHGGFVADVSANMPLPLPAGAVFAAFADYDNDGRLDLFAIGSDGRGYLLHNREGKRFDDVTAAAGVRDVAGARQALFVDLDHDGDLDLLLVGGGSLGAYRNNLDGTFTPFPNADGIVQGGTDAAFADVDDDGRTDVFVASAPRGGGGRRRPVPQRRCARLHADGRYDSWPRAGRDGRLRQRRCHRHLRRRQWPLAQHRQRAVHARYAVTEPRSCKQRRRWNGGVFRLRQRRLARSDRRGAARRVAVPQRRHRPVRRSHAVAAGGGAARFDRAADRRGYRWRRRSGLDLR